MCDKASIGMRQAYPSLIHHGPRSTLGSLQFYAGIGILLSIFSTTRHQIVKVARVAKLVYIHLTRGIRDSV